MITTNIEKCLLSGEARYKTFMLHGSAVGKIDIPANNFIIVTSITVFPFTDADPADESAVDQRSTHILELISQDSDRVGYIYRNAPLKQAGKVNPYSANANPITYDTYLVRSKTLYISVGCHQGVNTGGGYVYGPLQALTQLNDNPTSYGSKSPVVVTMNDDAGANIYGPTGKLESGNTNVNRVQPFPYYNGNVGSGALLDPEGWNQRTPCVLIQYVQFNDQAKKNFQ